MHSMATLVIKNFPDDLHARLKDQAQRHHRSVTKEVVSLVEQGLGTRRAMPDLPPPVKLKGGPISI
jgi:plasmid stability protein